MHLVKMYLPLLQIPTTFERTKILPTTFDKNPNYYEGLPYVRVCQGMQGARVTDMFGEDYELRPMAGLWQEHDETM